MLFNLDADEGHKLVAYVVPDTAATTPSIVLRAKGRELMRLEANNTLPTLIDAGRHTTGRCGFIIDDSVLPGVADYDDLELAEASQDVMIYRRRSPDALDVRMVRLETHLLPLWRIDEAVRRRFQFWYKGIDRFGRETATQVFNLSNVSSAYASGRLLYKNYEYYLSKGIKTIGMLRDPYCELAERLILLKNIGSRAEEILGERDAMIFAPVIQALSDWDEFDEAFCKRFLRRSSSEVAAILSNPLVRQLTASTPDEMPNQGAIATSLDALSAFELVGLRSGGQEFLNGLAELLEVDPASMPAVNEYPRIVELSERLRQNHDIEGILEKDLEVFHSLSSAMESTDA